MDMWNGAYWLVPSSGRGIKYSWFIYSNNGVIFSLVLSGCACFSKVASVGLERMVGATVRSLFVKEVELM